MSAGRRTRAFLFLASALGVSIAYQNCAPTGVSLSEALKETGTQTTYTVLSDDSWPSRPGGGDGEVLWESSLPGIAGIDLEVCKATNPPGANKASTLFDQARIIKVHGSESLASYACPAIEAPYATEFTPPPQKDGSQANPNFQPYIDKYNRFMSGIHNVDLKFLLATGEGKKRIAECWVDEVDKWARKGFLRTAPKARGADRNEVDNHRYNYRADYIPTMLWQYSRIKSLRAHLVDATQGNRADKISRIETYLKDVAVANLNDFQNRYLDAEGAIIEVRGLGEGSARIGMSSLLAGSLFNHANLKSGGVNLVNKTASRIDVNGLHDILKDSGRNAHLNHLRLAQALNVGFEVARVGSIALAPRVKDDIKRLNELMVNSLLDQRVFTSRVPEASDGPTREQLLGTYRHSIAWAELVLSHEDTDTSRDLVEFIRKDGPLIDRRMGGNLSVLWGVSRCHFL